MLDLLVCTLIIVSGVLLKLACPPLTTPIPGPLSLYSPHSYADSRSIVCHYTHPVRTQDPSSAEIDAIVASLYALLASGANPLGACAPESALGAGWIQASTEVSVLSAVSGVGLTQSVTPCDSEWGAAVAQQVRGKKPMLWLWHSSLSSLSPVPECETSHLSCDDA